MPFENYNALFRHRKIRPFDSVFDLACLFSPLSFFFSETQFSQMFSWAQERAEKKCCWQIGDVEEIIIFSMLM